MVFLNGKFMPIEEAHVPVLDRGFIFGDGVYELIPVYSRVPFRMDEHLARLERSLAAVRSAIPTAARNGAKSSCSWSRSNPSTTRACTSR